MEVEKNLPRKKFDGQLIAQVQKKQSLGHNKNFSWRSTYLVELFNKRAIH